MSERLKHSVGHDALARLAMVVSDLRGWRAWGSAFIVGALSTLALPPFHGPWILALTLPVLVWLLDGVADPTPSTRWRAMRRAAAIGWFFGFGYFLFGLYWIGFAFLVEADKFAFLLPLAVTLLPAGLALFTALATALARLVWFAGYRRVVMLAIIWTICEWLRGHLFTGFPWNEIGESLTASSALMQPAAMVGALGLSFIVMLVGGSLAAHDPRLPRAVRNSRHDVLIPVAAFCALGILWIGGAMRLAGATDAIHADLNLRIVQPNISLKEKWQNPDRAAAIIGQLLRMSEAATDASPMGMPPHSIIIWPEGALPVFLPYEPYLRSGIGRILPEGSFLITGGPRGEADEDKDPNRIVRFYNSLFVVDHRGEIVETYDKFHLVPFGEYVPFHNFLGRIGLKKITQFQGSFDTGPGPRTLSIGDLPSFSPLICYEIIFADEVIARDQRPVWLLTITNDAWFGDSGGPYQHFAQARMRAVEQGLPVIRAANTGISGVIDAYGRVKAATRLNTPDVLDVALPMPITPTLYARLGDGFLALLLATCGFAAAYGRKRY